MLSGNDSLIHVANLPDNANRDFLRSFFIDCGPIVQIETRKRSKESPLFAFIQFENKESALRAVEKYNYTKINNEPIIITYASIENMRIIYSGLGNLYISGIDENIEASQLHELFQKFGEVISCKVPTDNGKNRGYAYIQFKNPNDAERAKVEMQDATINRKPIKCELYVKSENSNTPFIDRKRTLDDVFTILFIQNLPDNVLTLADLVALFIDYGNIQSARLLPGKNAGFVKMGDNKSARKAIAGLNGQIYLGKRLIVTRALMKEERLAFNNK